MLLGWCHLWLCWLWLYCLVANLGCWFVFTFVDFVLLTLFLLDFVLRGFFVIAVCFVCVCLIASIIWCVLRCFTVGCFGWLIGVDCIYYGFLIRWLNLWVYSFACWYLLCSAALDDIETVVWVCLFWCLLGVDLYFTCGLLCLTWIRLRFAGCCLVRIYIV